MTKAATTVKYFGGYLMILGVGLIVVPNVLLPLFGMAPTSEVWIHVVGLVVFNEGACYWLAAKSEARPFFQASVYLRAVVPFVFAAFVLAGWASPVLVLFGIADMLAGVWTWLALRGEKTAV